MTNDNVAVRDEAVRALETVRDQVWAAESGRSNNDARELRIALNNIRQRVIIPALSRLRSPTVGAA